MERREIPWGRRQPTIVDLPHGRDRRGDNRPQEHHRDLNSREGRFGDRPTQRLGEITKSRGGAEFAIVDRRDHLLPFFNKPTSPAFTPPRMESRSGSAAASRVVAPCKLVVSLTMRPSRKATSS